MEKSTAIGILKSRQVITEACVKKVKCTQVTRYHRELGNGVTQVAIANFACMSTYGEQQAIALLKEGKYEEALNTNLNSSIRSTDFMPEKGRNDIVEFGTYINKDGVESLGIDSIGPLEVDTTVVKSSEFDAFEEEEEADLVAEEEADMKKKKI